MEMGLFKPELAETWKHSLMRGYLLLPFQMSSTFLQPLTLLPALSLETDGVLSYFTWGEKALLKITPGPETRKEKTWLQNNSNVCIEEVGVIVKCKANRFGLAPRVCHLPTTRS